MMSADRRPRIGCIGRAWRGDEDSSVSTCCVAGGRIADVEIVYPRDIAKQALRYAEIAGK